MIIFIFNIVCDPSPVLVYMNGDPHFQLSTPAFTLKDNIQYIVAHYNNNANVLLLSKSFAHTHTCISIPHYTSTLTHGHLHLTTPTPHSLTQAPLNHSPTHPPLTHHTPHLPSLDTVGEDHSEWVHHKRLLGYFHLAGEGIWDGTSCERWPQPRQGGATGPCGLLLWQPPCVALPKVSKE